ncbi:hypothetical protein QM042_02355 [Escherichia coli]|uniref:ATP-binding protein n=1 Tax=Escherichia coli TaxID=562 RepID=UPI0039860918
MKFLTLEVENFMALANAKVELDQRGLVLLDNTNPSSTFPACHTAGKSTLMNSLMWCIYGETSRSAITGIVCATAHEKT